MNRKFGGRIGVGHRSELAMKAAMDERKGTAKELI